MIVLIDGKEVEVLNEIKVVQELGDETEVLVTITHEGMILEKVYSLYRKEMNLKDEYILLDKEYSNESLYDLDRDVSECFDIFPQDIEYKKIRNKDDFLGGIYKVSIIYIPGEGDEI